MKKLFFICSILLTSICAQSQDIDFGLGPTLAFNGPVFGVQARGGYAVTERFRPTFTYTYYIRKNTNFALDFDAKYRLFSIEEYDFNPIAGINVARVDGTTRVALNLGLFILINREWVDIYLEPKMVVDDLSYFVLSGGLFF